MKRIFIEKSVKHYFNKSYYQDITIYTDTPKEHDGHLDYHDRKIEKTHIGFSRTGKTANYTDTTIIDIINNGGNKTAHTTRDYTNRLESKAARLKVKELLKPFNAPFTVTEINGQFITAVPSKEDCSQADYFRSGNFHICLQVGLIK